MDNTRAAFLRGLRTGFFDEYELGLDGSYIQQLATPINSSGRAEPYGQVSQVPELEDEEKEGGGGLSFDRLTDKSILIPNKSYQKGLEVHLDDLDDDLQGIYLQRAKDLGGAVPIFQDGLLLSLLENGTTVQTGLTVDGKAFFADDHPADPTTDNTSGNVNDNNLAGSLDKANFYTAVNALRQMEDDKGRKVFNRRMDLTLVVPTALVAAAEEIVVATLSGGGDTNTANKKARILEIPELSSVGAWYVYNRRGSKPFILQNRKKLVFERAPKNNDSEFSRNSIQWKARWRGRIVYGQHTKIVRSV